jgi:hypothetical protein
MTAPAAILATWATYKPVPTRNTLQLVLEVPLEQQEEVFRRLGYPVPGKETWVAVGLYQPAEKPEKAEKPDHKRVTRVAMLCKDTHFQQWVREHINFDNWENAEANAKEYILANLKLESRRELAVNDDAWQRMLGIIDGFNRWAGRAAELRS